MSPAKLSLSNSFYRAMGFTDQEMRPTDGFVAQVFSTLLWSVMVQGDPVLVADIPRHPFNLKSGEIPLFFFGSVVYSKETVSRGNQGGYVGMWVMGIRKADYTRFLGCYGREEEKLGNCRTLCDTGERFVKSKCR